MSDYDLQLLRAFRSDVPFADEGAVERMLDRLTGRATTRSRLGLRPYARGRRVTIAVALAALLLAAASFAAVKEGPWWAGGAPPVDPQAVVSVARDNMPANVRVAEARTVATAGDAALVAVPLDETGYCLIPALAGRASFGASCVYRVTHPERGDSDSAAMAVRAQSAGTPGRWIAYGRITDPRAAAIDLGAVSVPLVQGGFFVAEIAAAKWSTLDGTANPGAIVDGSGRVLRRGCVNWGPSPTAPGRTGSFESPTSLWLDSSSGGCKPQTVPPPPTLDLSHAEKIFDVTLTQPYSIWQVGQKITFEAAPASDGTTCVVLVGPGLPATLDRTCQGLRLAPPPAGTPRIDPAVGAQLAHRDGKAFYAWDISGTTDPAAGISRLTLSSPSASAIVTYRDGFFFAQLPLTTPGPAVGTIPFPDGPWTLTGYDDAGRQIARIDLNAQYRRSTPH
jgi:hypothetical protein